MISLKSHKGDIDKALDDADLIQKSIKSISEYVFKQMESGLSEKHALQMLHERHLDDQIIEKIMAAAKKMQDEKKASEVDIQDVAGKSAMKVHAVSKAFGENQVLKEVSLDISKGDLVGIIGLSGSGKTTLLSILIGLLQPEEGAVYFRHPSHDKLLPVLDKKREMTKVFGFAPQDPSFYSKLTVWENLDHFGSLYNIHAHDRKETITSLLELVGLENAHKTLGENLSGGMQRRLGIACSLIHNPEVLILDEPTADLDPVMRKEIWNLIKEINNHGRTVILTSHFLSEVEGLCNKIAILHGSKIVAYGTPNQLKDGYSKNEEIRLETHKGDYKDIMKALKDHKLDIKQMAVRDHRLVLYAPQADKMLRQLLGILEKQGEKIVDVELNKPSLNEVFESIVVK
ncbi:ABC transporter ATP-binding protein [Candidatus Woesearchaeota archaeon]|nr:ABC transporter ATP-binding protein [Candidatus Woesearchaeota archaeon]